MAFSPITQIFRRQVIRTRNPEPPRRPGMTALGRKWAPISLPLLLLISGCFFGSGVDPLSYPDAADALVIPAGPDTTIVSRYGTVDILMHSDRKFNAKGRPNPFTDINVQAVVWTPDGRRFHVDGFFDGDGKGGSSGRVFKIRLCPDTEGIWSWEIISGLSELHGVSGQILCRGALPGLFARGAVVVHPKFPRAFSYADGTPVYLLAKFLDRAAPEPIRYSHTFFSEQVTDESREEMLIRHQGMKCNRMNIYLANRGDYGGIRTTPWVDGQLNKGHTVFKLSHWRMYEHWLRRLRDEGMAAHIWFFADDSDFGKMPLPQRLQLIRYGMARLSGFANTIFVLCLEWEEGWSRKDVETAGLMIQEENPWNRLVSVHGTTGDFDFPESDWVDYHLIQSGNKAVYDTVYTLGLRNRKTTGKPLLNEEFTWGEEDDTGRQKAWSAFFAGAAGSGTGAYLAPMSEFIASVPFARLTPLSDLMIRGKAFLLGEKGRLLLAYLPEGGSIEVSLRDYPDDWTGLWCDPRTGQWGSPFNIKGGGTQILQSPGKGDWVLRIRGDD